MSFASAYQFLVSVGERETGCVGVGINPHNWIEHYCFNLLLLIRFTVELYKRMGILGISYLAVP